MTKIAILTPVLTTADAISNDVYGMYEVLTRQGHEVSMFAQTISANGFEVSPVAKIQAFLTNPTDILIYHYSMGWNVGLQLLANLKCRKVVKYHNITPDKFFKGFSTAYEETCRTGRQQITDIVNADCDLYLADSEYNLWELWMQGIDKAKGRVVPPFHHIDRLNSLPPDMEVLNNYSGQEVKILMVGRVAPNKGHVTLIQSFAIYREHYNPEAILFIVGKEPEQLERYSHYLREMMTRLDVSDSIVFTGKVSEAQLKAYYLIANIFMIASQHEGFCVPLVEAMAMKVPIVACASSAIPGTVGKAGIVWKERDPFLLAESINFLTSDEETSVDLGLSGWRRYQQLFTNEKIEAELLNALGPWV